MTRPDNDVVAEALELLSESYRKAAKAKYNQGELLAGARRGLREQAAQARIIAGDLRSGKRGLCFVTMFPRLTDGQTIREI